MIDPLADARALFDFDRRFYDVKSMVNVVFGAAIGAYIGFEFTTVKNDSHTFLALTATLVLTNGFVISLLMVGSSISRQGFRKSSRNLMISIFWTAGLIWVSQSALHQGWIYAAILVPWWIAAIAYTTMINLVFVKFPRQVTE